MFAVSELLHYSLEKPYLRRNLSGPKGLPEYVDGLRYLTFGWWLCIQVLGVIEYVGEDFGVICSSIGYVVFDLALLDEPDLVGQLVS